MLLAVWLCGCIAALLYGWARWRRVAAAVRSSTPLSEGRELEALRRIRKKAGGPTNGVGTPARPTVAPRRFGWGGPPGLPSSLKLVSSTAKLEPGVFGIFRPVLWLPAGIGDRLDDAEIEAILAHELCHVRRRDNLLATVHMAVEAVFWFHPLVWWLGARLEEERERACDEEVVRMGGEPQVYAEGILKVCEFYLASPVACAAGVTGGELKKRIEGIMTNRFTRELSYGKKVLLTVVAMAAVAAPIAIGLMNPPRSRAQAQTIAVQDSSSKELPEFEVASIKPSKQDGSSWGCLPGGRITGVQTVVGLIGLAYIDEVRRDYIVNVPKWGDDDRYAISAIPPKSSKSAQIQYRTVYPSKEQQQMLQSLLIQRFHLKFHREFTKEPAYLVSLRKKPDVMQLRPPKDEHGPSYVGVHIDNLETGSTSLVVLNSTMSVFAREVGRYTKLNVVDRTGLAGSYDFRVPFYSLQEESGKETGSDFGTSVLMGLREFGFDVKSAKTPIEHIVIDHVDRPSEN